MCPACNSKRHTTYDKSILVNRCTKCGAVFGSCYLGDSYAIVKPYFHADINPSADQLFYFDLECLGSAGLTRRHGWAHKVSKMIVQVG